MSSTVNFYAMKAIQGFRGKVLKRASLHDIIEATVNATNDEITNAIKFLVRKKMITKVWENNYLIN